MELRGELNARGLVIGIVWSRFNEPVVRKELEACMGRLAEMGLDTATLCIASVPGALELPLAVQRLAGTGRFAALIALGAVIRGETYHFELVSNESAAGITRVQLETGVPVANGVLTTEDDAQAEARAVQKGRDCAEAAVEMARLLRDIEQSRP
jgi:6,7-dimethyl-8-ribityllumazine synthase